MNAIQKLDPSSATVVTPQRVWYAAYGSNMHLSRLNYYLCGGKPPNAARSYPGCRDSRTPTRWLSVMLPGQLYFALESRTWTGGMSFYDPDAPGETPARAYLITTEQFSDIAAQEMHREPGGDLDLGDVLTRGRASTGPGRYETLVCPGLLGSCPVLTFTACWKSTDVAWNKPSAPYLRHLASGLMEAHGWTAEEAAGYLASRPGAAGAWRPEHIAELVAAAPDTPQAEPLLGG